MRRLFPTLLLLLLLLTGCRPDVSTFSAFQSIDAEGWWREDTLTFTVDTLRPNARYAVTLSLRTAAAPEVYPYTDLVLAVRTQFSSAANTDTTSNATAKTDTASIDWTKTGGTQTDTLHLTLATTHGDAEGRGTSLYQYDFVINTLSVGTSAVSTTSPLTISLYHLMRRDPLPGIRDVGIELRAL